MLLCRADPRHHTGTVDLQQATTQLANGLQHTPDQGPTLAAGWGVFSFLAASFSAALGLSSLAASFFSNFFSAACMPGRTMSEPSRQQQVPLCQETPKILPGIERQANIRREATVSIQSLARADPVLPGQGDQTMTHSSLHSSQGAPCPRRLQQYCVLNRCCHYSHNWCRRLGTDRLIHSLLALAGPA